VNDVALLDFRFCGWTSGFLIVVVAAVGYWKMTKHLRCLMQLDDDAVAVKRMDVALKMRMMKGKRAQKC
jgi:hypothetical protein